MKFINESRTVKLTPDLVHELEKRLYFYTVGEQNPMFSHYQEFDDNFLLDLIASLLYRNQERKTREAPF